MENEIKGNKKLGIILIIAIGILVFLVGASYAIYKITLEGQKTHTINTSKITFTYEEPTNELSIETNVGMSDIDGMAQNNYFEFNVKASSTLADTLPYDIFLTRIIKNYNFPESQVKIYLTQVENNVEIQKVGPTLISNLSQINYDLHSKRIHQDSFIFDGINQSEITHTYRLRVWLDEDFDINDIISTYQSGDGSQHAILDEYTFSFKINVVNGSFPNLDTSGANEPELAAGMVPIYYDSTESTWKIASETNNDVSHQWYSYASEGTTKGMWANAALVKETGTQTREYYTNQENVGEAVSMDDILAMLVWIPRFSAVTPSNYNGGTAATPGAIDVNFVDTNTTAHDAFTFDGDKSGIWVGKFETSHATNATSTIVNNLGCVDETCSSADGLIIKPNALSMGFNNASNLFYVTRSMERNGNPFGLVGSEIDTHIMKNNEWGAVAYLTHSIYGRCSNATTCSEVWVNPTNNGNSSSQYSTVTGCSGATVSASLQLGMTACTSGYQYNGELNNGKSSTTANVYGIYDMSGGTPEYVMGNYNNIIGSSGFSTLPESKYINVYTETSYQGNALSETSGWYSDSASFVNNSSPWFIRGGHSNSPTSAGIFYYYSNNGAATNSVSSRLIIVK